MMKRRQNQKRQNRIRTLKWKNDNTLSNQVVSQSLSFDNGIPLDQTHNEYDAAIPMDTPNRKGKWEKKLNQHFAVSKSINFPGREKSEKF